MHSSTPFQQAKKTGDPAFSLADDQLQTMMLAAGPLPPDKRGVFLERVAARLRAMRTALHRRRPRPSGAAGAEGADPRVGGLPQRRRKTTQNEGGFLRKCVPVFSTRRSVQDSFEGDKIDELK
jgi:hypothetical protein